MVLYHAAKPTPSLPTCLMFRGNKPHTVSAMPRHSWYVLYEAFAQFDNVCPKITSFSNLNVRSHVFSRAARIIKGEVALEGINFIQNG